jgi:hypothetical protein
MGSGCILWENRLTTWSDTTFGLHKHYCIDFSISCVHFAVATCVERTVAINSDNKTLVKSLGQRIEVPMHVSPYELYTPRYL